MASMRPASILLNPLRYNSATVSLLFFQGKIYGVKIFRLHALHFNRIEGKKQLALYPDSQLLLTLFTCGHKIDYHMETFCPQENSGHTTCSPKLVF